MTEGGATSVEDSGAEFGYEYFDDPFGNGYRGYRRDGNGDGTEAPWHAAREFCEQHGARSAIDIGCAKGFLVAELLAAGIDAVGYDVSEYALAFAQHLPCFHGDIRLGVASSADVVFILGVLIYLDEKELPAVLAKLRAVTRRFLCFSNYYEGGSQEVPDPHRRITKPYRWWRDLIVEAGFIFHAGERCFDVYTL